MDAHFDKTHYWPGTVCFTVLPSHSGFPHGRSYVGEATEDGNWFRVSDWLEPTIGPLSDPEDDEELQVRICSPVYDAHPGEF